MRYYYPLLIGEKNSDYYLLKDYLDTNNISYELDVIPTNSTKVISTKVYLDTNFYHYLRSMFPEKHIWTDAPLKEISKRDVENAEWLEIRPKYIPIHIYNLDQQIVTKKHLDREGKVMHRDFRTDGVLSVNKYKFPNNTHFAFGNGVSSLFISSELKEVLENNELRNIDIYNTYYKGKIYDKVYELRSKNTLNDDILVPDEYTKIRQCTVCGKKQYQFWYRINVKKEIMDMNADFFMTDFMFGQGDIYANAFFISHRFYEVLKKNKMTRSIVLEPLNLV